MYKTLLQLQQLIQLADLMWAWDLKSGYHHLALPPKAWRFSGFCWRGRLYIYRVLPFGWAPACRLFTLLMAAVWLLLRAAGARKVCMLDDCASAASTQQEAAFQVQTKALLLSGLGLFPSLGKCRLRTDTRIKFLGLEHDSAQLCTYLPADRLQRVQQKLIEAWQDTLLAAE